MGWEQSDAKCLEIKIPLKKICEGKKTIERVCVLSVRKSVEMNVGLKKRKEISFCGEFQSIVKNFEHKLF